MADWRMGATRWLKERVSVGQRRKLVLGRLAARSYTAGFRALPDFVIIGAQRCGTSSLYKYLGAHPRIVPSLRKETEYLSTRFTEGEEWYRAHFPLRYRTRSARRLTFEATPDYLLDPRAADRASVLIPESRIIAMVRDPVDRAYSQYWHNRRLGHEPLEFGAAIAAEDERIAGEFDRLLADPAYPALPLRRHAYVGRGMYAEQLRRWQRHYPPDRIHVARFEDLIADPAGTIRAIERFLGVDDWMPKSFANHSYGLAGKATSQPMDQSVRAQLEAIFEPANRELDALLAGFPGWQRDGGRFVE